MLISCTPKKTEEQTNVPTSNTSIEKSSPPVIQKTDIPVPQMALGLASWDDLEAPSTVYKPVAGLALSHDHTKCFKEWFQGDSLPPNVRKFQGRILGEDEKTIGRMILCPEERKKDLLEALQNNP